MSPKSKHHCHTCWFSTDYNLALMTACSLKETPWRNNIYH